eukprot:scaffold44018_cov70-Phaeocystis_antarctica.AAC.7
MTSGVVHPDGGEGVLRDRWRVALSWAHLGCATARVGDLGDQHHFAPLGTTRRQPPEAEFQTPQRCNAGLLFSCLGLSRRGSLCSIGRTPWQQGISRRKHPC